MRAEDREEGAETTTGADEDAGWEGWDVESDSDEESSDGWVGVSSDEEDLEISDSEDEKGTRRQRKGKDKRPDDSDDEDQDQKMEALGEVATEVTSELKKESILATQKVLLTFFSMFCHHDLL